MTEICWSGWRWCCRYVANLSLRRCTNSSVKSKEYKFISKKYNYKSKKYNYKSKTIQLQIQEIQLQIQEIQLQIQEIQKQCVGQVGDGVADRLATDHREAEEVD